MHLHDLLDPVELNEMATAGYVMRKTHPDLPLALLGYTARTQFDRAWNHTTRTCRGLIYHLDTNGIVARPFGKFMNVGEHLPSEIPRRLPDRVDDKLDGSLAIAYPTVDGPAIATRGSFASDQALWATAWLRATHPEWEIPLGRTVLFEILYPENRIVVSYGGRAELVLLAVIDTLTGEDRPLDEARWPGASVDHVPPCDLSALAGDAEDRDNAEGFVAVWHRIVTGLSNRSVWEHLAAGRDFDDLIATIPDEFHTWLARVAAGLRADVETVTTTTERDLDRAITAAGGRHVGRGLLAEQIKTTTHPGLCFALLDGKSIHDKVWRMVRPERETPMLDRSDAE